MRRFTLITLIVLLILIAVAAALTAVALLGEESPRPGVTPTAAP